MIIKNNILSVNVNSFGAEVKSIIKDKTEYVWQGDSKYWKRSSPVLFPIVGRLIDDEYIYNNTTYKLSQHGFARDNEFDIISSSESECSFQFKDNKSTLEKYPFKFNLIVGYKLFQNELMVNWIVENTNKQEMYFQIGAHPAFNFLNGSFLDINSKTNKYELEGTPYIHSVISNVDVDSIKVTNETFLEDALVFDNVDQVTLRDDDKSVTIECVGFPFVGIWTKTKDNVNAPFVCIEPWHGIADCAFHDKQLKNKKGIIRLEASTKFEASYKIIIK